MRCPKCSDVNSKDSTFEYIIPKAFRTDFSSGKDATEIDLPVFQGTGSFIEREFNHDKLEDFNCKVDRADKGNVFRINDNNRKFFSGSIGTVSRNSKILKNQWIDSNHSKYVDTYFSFNSEKNKVEKIALASKKQTEVFSIIHDVIPEDLDLDLLKKGSAMKGAYYSAAFFLRILVAEKWDIDPEELDIGNIVRRENSNEKYSGEIRLNDHLPNGAGFSTQIREIISEILKEVRNPKKSKFMKNIKEHFKCDSSCHDCLKAYRNINYHGLLDWRLGISLLKTFADLDYKCGSEGNFLSYELKGWKEKAISLRDEFCKNFDCSKKEYDLLPGFSVGSKMLLLFILFGIKILKMV